MASLPQSSEIDSPLFFALLGIYWLFVVFGGIKLVVSLFSLYRIHLKSSFQSWESYTFNNLKVDTAPFSFLTRIYLNFEKHSENELHTILRHEQVHTKNLHSADILLIEIWCIFSWFNPVSWWLKKAMKVNVEFIADREVVQQGIAQDAYQNSLLHFAIQSQKLSLANQFAFLSLKSRINMMNKKQSSKGQLGEYFLVVPIIIFSLFIFGVSKAYKTSESTEIIFQELIHQTENMITQDTALSPKTPLQIFGFKKGSEDSTTSNIKKSLVIIDGKTIDQSLEEVKKNVPVEDIASISVLKGQRATSIYGYEAKDEAIVITTKGGDQSDDNKGKIISMRKSTRPSDDGIARIVGSLSISKKEGDGEENKQPLYIVDGKEMEPSRVKTMDPNEIKSITVFKGKNVEESYGERGANGVIEIQLK